MTGFVIGSPRRPWRSFAASAALHAAVIVLAAVLARSDTADDAEKPEVESRPPMELVYLPPPPEPEPEPAWEPPAPAPEPPPAEPPPPPAEPPPPPVEPPPPPVEPALPPPPAEQPEAEPDANAPPDAIRTEGTEDPADQPDEASETTTSEPAGETRERTELATAPTMESEARRIFGRPRIGTPPGAGPQRTRPMEAYMPDNPNECIPQEQPPRDPDTPPRLGTAVGRIFRQDNGQPLPGAHLQMIGTPYVTFTNDRGEYRFVFDLSLVQNCRTQYVRVTANGYESRLLVLVVGQNARSEDVRLKRK